ncbi:MAG: hypothetical protein Q4C81_08470 [Kocuria sp.]|nr:hypothetical protein [Kocuria sp.]
MGRAPLLLRQLQISPAPMPSTAFVGGYGITNSRSDQRTRGQPDPSLITRRATHSIVAGAAQAEMDITADKTV